MKKLPESKIFRANDLLVLRNKWKEEQHKVVFTNGCFDIIHLGHIDYLSKASSLGDKLIVAVNSDESVRLLKGDNRPIQDEICRLIIMASFYFVDAVVLFSEETPFNIINLLKPDILVKGGDYKADSIVGADIVKGYGGKVEIIPFLEGYSTSAIENKIVSFNK